MGEGEGGGKKLFRLVKDDDLAPGSITEMAGPVPIIAFLIHDTKWFRCMCWNSCTMTYLMDDGMSLDLLGIIFFEGG